MSYSPQYSFYNGFHEQGIQPLQSWLPWPACYRERQTVVQFCSTNHCLGFSVSLMCLQPGLCSPGQETEKCFNTLISNSLFFHWGAKWTQILMKCTPFAIVSWTCLECVAARKDTITFKWSPPKTSIISKLLHDQGQYSTNSAWMQWHNRAMLWNKALIVLLFVKVQWPHSLM